jgi:CRISPR-associated endonuclease/helicase Cas3
MISGGKEAIHEVTVILPPSVGGLSSTGTLDGGAEPDDTIKYDVADMWFSDKEETVKRRIRVWDNDPQFDEKTRGMRLVRVPLDTRPDADENESEPAGHRYWNWYTKPRSADDDLSKTCTTPIKWQHHTDDVTERTQEIIKTLNLPGELPNAMLLAAKFHDLGKRRDVWQRSIGNPNPANWHAKSGKPWKPSDICPDYRHEFGSLLDVEDEPEFKKLIDKDMQDLVLHLIAAHHGRGRPHFPLDEVLEPEPKGKDVTKIASEVPQRFARLQRKYGRWGLAYLESLLRAADYAASADPSEAIPKQLEEKS